MSNSNNETPALITALVLVVALIGGAGWWLKSSGFLGGGESPVTTTEPVLPDPSATATSPPNTGSSNDSNSAVNSFAEVPNVPAGSFAYGGSTTWAPLRGAVDPLIQEAVPGFQLNYKDAASSSAGIQMLIDRELDFAQSSRPLNSAEKRRSQQAGIALEEIPVALEAVAIATNTRLSIPGLTLAQLKDIYTGKVTNWSQVGGPNLAIAPASRSDDGGTVQFFQEDVLAGEDFADNVTILGSTTEALRFVSSTPGAIYFASAPEVVGQCTIAPVSVGASSSQLVAPYRLPYVEPADCPVRRNQLNLDAFQSQSYPLLRPLYVAIRKDGSTAEQAGRAYVDLLKTSEGQGLLSQVGFVPLP
ncbi:MAG: PstS family phosphate ABC transporter substrate-binding protein [Phormidesmis sp.]